MDPLLHFMTLSIKLLLLSFVYFFFVIISSIFAGDTIFVPILCMCLSRLSLPLRLNLRNTTYAFHILSLIISFDHIP